MPAKSGATMAARGSPSEASEHGRRERPRIRRSLRAVAPDEIDEAEPASSPIHREENAAAPVQSTMWKTRRHRIDPNQSPTPGKDQPPLSGSRDHHTMSA